MATKSLPSLDTNVLLRLILRDDTKLMTQVLHLLEQHEQFAVADQAIVEIVYVLGGYYQYSRSEITQVIRTLMHTQHVELNHALFERVLPAYEAHAGVSFSDCCLEAYAHLNGQTPLYTFDKKLARQLAAAELIV